MGPWHAEFRYLHPNGRELWVEGHSAPERQSDDSTVWHGVLTDVTERKQTEEHLRLSQARLGEALRAGRLGTWMIDVTTQQIWFDLRSRSMLALSPYDTTWLSLSEITGMLHVDDRTRVLRALDRYLQGLPDRVAEQFRMVRTDGRTVFLSVSGAAERDAAGLVVKLAGTLADMTEQRHAQQRLRDSEDRFARLFELSPASQLLVRVPDHRIIEANDAAARLLGCAREDLIGLAAPADVIDLALEGQDVLWSCLGANRPDRGVVIEGFRRDGTSFYAEASRDIFRMDDEDHALVVMMDLTARRTAEHALRASEERFRQIAESIAEAFWIMDDGQVTYASPAVGTILGRPDGPLTSEGWLAAVHPDDADRVGHRIRGLNTVPADDVYRIVRPDGEVRWVRSRARSVRQDQGRAARMIGIIEDITEQRRLEEQLRQAQKMESMGQLASGVAHDFNNWLTVIIGYVELLGTMVPGDSMASKCVAEIRRASERATGLTRQLLAFSRKEAIEPRVVDVNALVADTQRMLRRLLGEDVTLTSTLSPVAGRIKVDPTQWAQVLTNLAVNSRDAMPKGGRLSIETESVLVDPERAAAHNVASGRFVCVSVTDTGTGMPPEVQARVFEPFFTTKGAGKGTGLGLAVVFTSVERSGGFVELTSGLGRGTQFRLFVPEANEAPATASPPSSEEVTGSERVLVVEDEGSLRDVAGFTLKGYGYDVLLASGGEDAIRMLNEHGADIDVVFTDVVMPDKGGREVAEAAQAQWPHIKVIYTSGYTDDAMLRYGVAHAEVPFLQKPYTPRELLMKIRSVMQ